MQDIKEWHKADMYYKVNGLEGHAKVKIRLKGHGLDHFENLIVARAN